VGDSGRQAAERFHARTALRRSPQGLVVVAVDEHPEYSPAATFALHRQIAAKDSLRTVEPAQLDFDDAACARNIAPRSPSARLDHLVDEALARYRLGIADAEEAPHTRVRADDVAIEIDDDRGDHAARFQNGEVEVSRLP